MFPYTLTFCEKLNVYVSYFVEKQPVLMVDLRYNFYPVFKVVPVEQSQSNQFLLSKL